MITWEKVNPASKKRYRDHPYDDAARLMNWKLLIQEFNEPALEKLAMIDIEIRSCLETREQAIAIPLRDFNVAGIQHWRLIAMIRKAETLPGYPFIFIGEITRYLGNISSIDKGSWVRDAHAVLNRRNLLAASVNWGRLYHAIGSRRQIVAASSVAEFVVAHGTEMELDRIVYA